MVSKANRSRQAVLGFLTWGPMSGYDIKRVVEFSISNFWSESYGQIYPILRELEAEGLATCASKHTQGGRPRNVYTITRAGRRELRRWLAEPTIRCGVRHEELLKLFFGSETDREVNVRRIETYRAEVVELLEHYAEIERQLTGAKGPGEGREYWLMTLRYGQLEVGAQLAWCDEVLPQLRARLEGETA